MPETTLAAPRLSVCDWTIVVDMPRREAYWEYPLGSRQFGEEKSLYLFLDWLPPFKIAHRHQLAADRLPICYLQGSGGYC